jgi:hypothetical protein
VGVPPVGYRGPMSTDCPFEIISGADVDLEPTPDGPLLVRNADAVLDDDGVLHPVRRPVVGVCTCGFSQRTPWCDGTHKVATNA